MSRYNSYRKEKKSAQELAEKKWVENRLNQKKETKMKRKDDRIINKYLKTLPPCSEPLNSKSLTLHAVVRFAQRVLNVPPKRLSETDIFEYADLLVNELPFNWKNKKSVVLKNVPYIAIIESKKVITIIRNE